jgi:hypothetical protein
MHFAPYREGRIFKGFLDGPVSNGPRSAVIIFMEGNPPE